MRIRRLEIVRLYGSFTKTVEFDPGLNLLVGINGSGKTSVLNCIDWLTKPNLGRLACTQFHSLKLNFDHLGKEYEIHAHRTSSLLTIEATGGQLSGDPITVEIARPTASIRSEDDLQEALQYYARLGAEPHEKQVWSFLDDLPDPLSVSLDRTIAAESEGEHFFEARVARAPGMLRARTPLSKVQSVTQKRYALYSQKLKALNESLKSKIIMSAFKSSFLGIKGESAQYVTIDQLNNLESKVTSLLYSSVDVDMSGAESITQYFDEARFVLQRGENDPAMRRAFYAQYRQIQGLAEAFNDFEEKSDKAYEAIDSYLTSLNIFFLDTKKYVGFSDSDGTLGFRSINHDGEAYGPYLSVDRMSSGERQLLILITFLAFVSKKNQIFIVDEPELSLHPRWQRSFVGAVLNQAPLGTQVIMATHSPEIVSRYRDKCVVLDV